MVRARRFIEIIEEHDLGTHIAAMGDRLMAGLRTLSRDTGAFTNVRGMGSLVAVTMPSGEIRGAALGRMFDNELLALPSGPVAIRFRLPFVIQAAEIDEILNRVEASLT
jgi:L-lysine 6-transaminase